MPEKANHQSPRSPEYVLLGFLYEEPCHGYTLHQQLINEFGYIWHISQSHTYSILKRLEAQGYIASIVQEQEKLPPRQTLHITVEGHRRFEDWLHTPTGSSVRAVRVELIARLYFARKYYPEMISPILADQSVEIKTALARLEKDRKALPAGQTFDLLSLELRILELRAVRDWLIECQKTFEINS